MHVVLLSENLQKKLSFVNHGVSPRSHLPVLLHILLQAKEGKLTLKSTDLEIGIQTSINANVKKEGAITVPAKTFSELIASLPAGKVTLTLDNATLKLSCGAIASTFQTIAKEEFPTLFQQKGEQVLYMTDEQIEKILPKIIFAASTDVGRPALSGMLIRKQDEGLVLVATDGYRLSLMHAPLLRKKGALNTLDQSLLIPTRVLRELLSLKDEDGGVSAYTEKTSNQVVFEKGETVVVGRLIEAPFPEFEKILPADASTRFVFDREELLKAVKLCAIFAREAANIVRFSIKKDKMIVSANSPSVGENIVEVEGKLKGEENDIAFNVRYLLDVLGNVEEKEMVFEMTGPLNPGVFKVQDDSSFLHLIMPIRVQG